VKQDPAASPLISDGHLVLHRHRPEEQRIPLGDILLIGEHSDDSGPAAEDLWLTLVLRDDRMIDIPSGYPEFDALYVALGMALGDAPFSCGLADRTTHASRILWPIEHAGSPLLEFEQIDLHVRSSWSTVAYKIMADHGYAWPFPDRKTPR
jgi:hypothetical protein